MGNISSCASVKAVLFDLDNTLYDREIAFDSWANWFVRDQLRIEDEREQRSLLERIKSWDANGYGSKRDIFARLHKLYPATAKDADTAVEAFYDQFFTHIVLSQETDGLLAALAQKGLPFGVVTNGSARQWQKIDRLDLRRRTDCVFVSGTFGVKKPAPAIFRAAAECLGVAPAQILFVGDNPAVDIVGAGAVGMQTAWLPRNQPWPDGAGDVRPDHVLTSLAELRPLLALPAGLQ